MAAVFPANQVIVVGGGLAGMSAANTVVENGGAKGLAATSIQVRIVCRVRETMERCKDRTIKVQEFEIANMFTCSNRETDNHTTATTTTTPGPFN